jgi:predicted GH43/DUF377 family glycosyl hydrolase
MDMRWRKLGRVFCPQNETDWMVSHAATCVAWPTGGSRIRIYFTTRDAQNRGHVAWIEIDPRKPAEVLARATEPVLRPGVTGAFDDSGVSLACIVPDGDALLLYYAGWNLGVTVAFRNSIGLAVSNDGLHFERVSPAPVLDRNRVDPFSLSYPFVMRGGDAWRMWYGSNLRGGASEREMDHVIKHASGTDPSAWSPSGTICIGIEREGEYAFSRPMVVRDGALWRMWYSYRGEQYRIGYAESNDGLQWQRHDDRVGLHPSGSGWDAQSIEYPWVFDHDGQRYMLYNGDGYGRTGFGMAVLEQD